LNTTPSEKPTKQGEDPTGFTREQAEVYVIIANIRAKLMLAVATTLVFLAVTGKLLFDPSWPVAAVDAFLAPTVYQVFKHYFK